MVDNEELRCVYNFNYSFLTLNLFGFFAPFVVKNTKHTKAGTKFAEPIRATPLNPYYPCAILLCALCEKLCVLCGKKHEEHEGIHEVRKGNLCLTSPCRCATSLSFCKERDVLAKAKTG